MSVNNAGNTSAISGRHKLTRAALSINSMRFNNTVNHINSTCGTNANVSDRCHRLNSKI